MTIRRFTHGTKADEAVQRFEIFTGSGRRRDWSDEEKERIVAESYGSEASVCAVARWPIVHLAASGTTPTGRGFAADVCAGGDRGGGGTAGASPEDSSQNRGPESGDRTGDRGSHDQNCGWHRCSVSDKPRPFRRRNS
ncbi:transposase [Sinorhizobium medicae]|nr:transposase [Sinorhizobium medicae]